MNRKYLKQNSKKSFKKHYWLFVFACLIAAIIGVDFASTMTTIRSSTEYTSSAIISETDNANDNVIDNLFSGNVDEAKSISDKAEAVQENKAKNINGIELGYDRGVLAAGIKMIASGSVFVKLYTAISSLFGRTDGVTIFLFILSMLFSLFIWIFIKNNYRVAYRRVFIEGQYYECVSPNRFLYLVGIKKVIKPAFTLFLTSIYYLLWSLTIVGAVIKHYSYIMVPYILAENPDLPANDAITLSRKMMNGHKWECFVLDLSFLGWQCLGMLTLGLLNIFFINPYIESTYCQYYEYLRTLAKGNNLKFSDQLYDNYLYNRAGEESLNRAYEDVIKLESQKKVELKEKKGIRKILANVFGIVLSYDKEEQEYTNQKENQMKIKSYKKAIEGKSYPQRLSPFFIKERAKASEHLHYMRRYSIGSLIMMFFIFSFVGWLWEVSLFFFNTGGFVNRGVLHGPWLPIYGSGCVLILVFLYKLRSKPLFEFLVSVALCGVVEYFTSLILEFAHGGQKWWDYSGYFLNLNGRISAEGLLVFGLGGFAVVYFIAPVLDDWLKKIPLKIVIPLCAVLVALIIGDQIYSSINPNIGKGITDNDKYETKTSISESVNIQELNFLDEFYFPTETNIRNT